MYIIGEKHKREVVQEVGARESGFSLTAGGGLDIKTSFAVDENFRAG